MRLTEIVRVDSKGRITIPMVIREALNIVEGMHLVLIADTDKREILVSPVVSPGALVYEMHIEIQDVPGALAQVTETLARYGVDQISTHCTSVKRGEIAECMIIADFSKANISAEELKEKLIELERVRMITIRPVQREIS